MQITAVDSALLVIDVQEKLMAKISTAAAVIANISFLLDSAALMNVPVKATEQYPKGLGATVAALRAKLPDRPEKLDFSCCAVTGLADDFRAQARPKVILAGIESHVCVLHTAFDLLARDFRVFLAVDAMASRSRVDHDYALRRLEQAGAILTTAETIVFEWVGSSSAPQFRGVSQLVKDRMRAAEGGQLGERGMSTR